MSFSTATWVTTAQDKNLNVKVSVISIKLNQASGWTKIFISKVWLLVGNLHPHYGESKQGGSRANWLHMPMPTLGRRKNHITEALQLAMIPLELLFTNLI